MVCVCCVYVCECEYLCMCVCTRILYIYVYTPRDFINYFHRRTNPLLNTHAVRSTNNFCRWRGGKGRRRGRRGTAALLPSKNSVFNMLPSFFPFVKGIRYIKRRFRSEMESWITVQLAGIMSLVRSRRARCRCARLSCPSG